MWLNKPPLGVPLDWKKPINKDLVLHLTMNEGHGDKVYDLSGHGNHGTLKNFAFPSTVDSGWNPGRKGVGLKFDGSDDYINVPSITQLSYPFTVEFWYNPSRIHTENGVLISLPPICSIRFDTDADYLDCGLTTNRIGLARSNFQNNVWSYVGVVYASESDIRAYHNGIDKTVVTGDYWTAAGDNVEIGSRSGGFANIAGFIDEVRIYRRALSAAEIRERYINPWGVYLDEED